MLRNDPKQIRVYFFSSGELGYDPGGCSDYIMVVRRTSWVRFFPMLNILLFQA